MELGTLDAAAVSYIMELEAGYKQQLKELQNKFGSSGNIVEKSKKR